MKKLAFVVALAVLLPTAQAAEMSEEQKTFYALGAVLGQQMSRAFSPTPAEQEVIRKGLSDSLGGKKLAVDMETQVPKIQLLEQARQGVLNEKRLAEGKALADKAAKEKGAVKSASGLIFLSLKEGTGASPAATDIVTVHYRGTLPDGKEFDSSYSRNEPAKFPLNGVIPCWTEGVQKMKPGGKARLTCPPSIAYGEQGGGPIPPQSTLSFEVELLEITKAPAQAKDAPTAKPAAKPAGNK